MKIDEDLLFKVMNTVRRLPLFNKEYSDSDIYEMISEQTPCSPEQIKTYLLILESEECLKLGTVNSDNTTEYVIIQVTRKGIEYTKNSISPETIERINKVIDGVKTAAELFAVASKLF
ncbi:MAG: hypothetical protein J6A61_05880 [Clostridia bacterium]|nr:hypothetical protein [Clostridia bacterium]